MSTSARAHATPDTTPDQAALNAFFRIAEAWDLRVAEQRALLGDPPSSTFYKWKRERRGALGRDTLERISYLLGIWKDRSEEHTSELQSRGHLVCRLLLEK